MKNLDLIIDDLIGTCNSIEEVCHSHGIDYEQLTSKDYDYLDSQLFCCEGCDWWYSIEDMDGSQLCLECTEE